MFKLNILDMELEVIFLLQSLKIFVEWFGSRFLELFTNEKDSEW